MGESVDSVAIAGNTFCFSYVVRDLSTMHLIDSLNCRTAILECQNDISSYKEQLETCEKLNPVLKENDKFISLSDQIRDLRKEKKEYKHDLDSLKDRLDHYTKINKKTIDLNDSIGKLNKKIDDLRKDSIGLLSKKIDSLRKDSIEPLLEENENFKTNVIPPLKKAKTDCDNNHAFEKMVDNFLAKDEYVYGCFGVLSVLIIAITIISLKRGLSFTKGNTSICLGEKKKTRAKKAD
ncbi:MAG: hypothetical protein J6U20_12785 [Fibrobacter sp.]|nr:hypothetical protein [Fibrobacter sp.]